MIERIAVVGAGPAGLVTVKELRAAGFDAICFEKRSGIGGVFKYDPSGDVTTVWKGCQLTSSALVTSFSDFFLADSFGGPYPHRQYTHTEYEDYLHKYVERFSLSPHIRLETEVRRVSRISETSWDIEFRTVEGTEWTDTFDAVAVCTGLHQQPNKPNWPGLSEYEGAVVHSSAYKGNSKWFDGKRVLVVGGGESAEIAQHASVGAAKTFISLRRGPFILPREMRGYPNDYLGTRAVYSLPDYAVRSSNLADQEFRERVNQKLAPIRAQVMRWSGRGRARDRSGDADCDIDESIMSMRKSVGGTQFESFATKTEAFVAAIVSGNCELKSDISSFQADSVRFQDGSVEKVDLVVLCTGYAAPTFPFLTSPIDFQRLDGFCISRAQDVPPLAFIGFVRPNIGAMPPLAEMQARWFAQELAAESARGPQDIREIGVVSRPMLLRDLGHRLPTLVDFSSYLDAVATRVGCKPHLLYLIFRPRLLLGVYFGPFSGPQYRLVGPGAVPSLAKRVLNSAPIVVDCVRLFELGVSVVAKRFGNPRFQPHLYLRWTSDRRESPRSSSSIKTGE